jgi:hypothetical protein
MIREINNDINFWYYDCNPGYSNPGYGIQQSIEKLDSGFIFKNVDVDPIDSSKLNFLVFKWETSWSFPNSNHTHSDIFINLLIKLQNENFYFISNFSGEAHTRTDELSLSFLNKLKLNNVDINRLFVANNDSSKVGFNKVKYGSFILNTCYFPNFFLSTYNHLENYVVNLNPQIVPDKKFLCLNRRMFNHKYKIIEELFNRGLLDDTRFTWVNNKTPVYNLNKNLLSKLEIDPNNFTSIQLENDVMYGVDLSYNDQYLYTINPDWYYKSRVNIITETILNEKEIHITEKTWKAIYLGVPFVISASVGHLKTLRDMGFKTFNSVINEEYDNMVGDHKIKRVVDSAIELSNLYNSPEVLEVCKFNQDLYFDKNHRRKIFNDYFLNYLYDIEKHTKLKTLI